MRTRIKFCGITRIEDVHAAAAIGADALGFIFAAGSPRQLDLDRFDALLAVVPAFVTPVVLFRDNPRFEFDPTSCVLTHGEDADECSVVRDDVYLPESPLRELSSRNGVYEVDLVDELCPGGVCAPVIGNVFVYLDRHHLTATYGSTLAWFVEEKLRDQGFEF